MGETGNCANYNTCQLKNDQFLWDFEWWNVGVFRHVQIDKEKCVMDIRFGLKLSCVYGYEWYVDYAV